MGGRGRRRRSVDGQVWMVLMWATLMVQVKLVRSDINKDKQECAPQLAGLATCLPYVGAQAKAPTPDCCTGLKQVLKDSRKCLCILIKDRNDPSLGLKINATLALSLPQTCHAPANISECPTLLHLAPNDPEGKVFTDFAKAAAAPAAATTSPSSTDSSGSGGGTSAQVKSDGGGKMMAQNPILYGVLLCCFLLFHHITF